MALDAESPMYRHLIQNLSLVILGFIFAPACTLIAVFSSFFTPYTAVGRRIQGRRLCQKKNPSFRPRTVLVTGVGMAKGLAIARAFYQEGHIIIGADFEPGNIPVSGRFSKCLKRFFRLPTSWSNSSVAYVDALIEIIKKENVELWVSCSGVASAVEDGKAGDAVEKLTSCKAIQFGASLTELLHGKHSFIESARNLGLNVPTTQLVTSVNEAMKFLYEHPEHSMKQYIMKSVGLDDSVRADMTLLPRDSFQETQQHISRLSPSPSSPFVLQQFISGPEYCTHSIVIKGKVLAFTSCRSAGILMHYKALPAGSKLAQTMLNYTQIYAEKTGPKMTGHFSIDFLLDESSEQVPLMQRIYPIECNPRAHTAVVLFANDSAGMVDAYLNALDECGSEGIEKPVCTTTGSDGYFWVGHDIVVHLVLPFWDLANFRSSVSAVLREWMIFREHLLKWREGTFVLWDPWPAWWLYCIYWPATFMATILTRSWWSKCNVSTNKMFRCGKANGDMHRMVDTKS